MKNRNVFFVNYRFISPGVTQVPKMSSRPQNG